MLIKKLALTSHVFTKFKVFFFKNLICPPPLPLPEGGKNYPQPYSQILGYIIFRFNLSHFWQKVGAQVWLEMNKIGK